MPFPSVSAAAVGSQLERPIPTGSASPAGIAGGSERSSSSVQKRLLSPLSHKQGSQQWEGGIER